MRTALKNLELTALIALSCIALAYFTLPVQAQEASGVTVPYGQWLADYIIPIVGSVAAILVTVVLGILVRFLPPWLQPLVNTAVLKRLQALAGDAIEFGVQATAGAVKNAELTVPLGSSVVANAVQHAINTWPKAAIDKVGGVHGVKLAIIKELENRGVILPPDSTVDQVLSSPPVARITNP